MGGQGYDYLDYAGGGGQNWAGVDYIICAAPLLYSALEFRINSDYDSFSISNLSFKGSSHEFVFIDLYLK